MYVDRYKCLDYDYETVSCLKSLGIWIDSRFGFNTHVDKIDTWVRRRTGLLIKMRTTLAINETALLTIAISWRAKLVFGTYWLPMLSEHQMQKLCAIWARLINAAVGFIKLVPFKKALDFFGPDKEKV